MGKNDRDVVARRELTHALEALGDGIGHETWGPGPVIERLSKRELKEPAVRMATEALEAATMASHDLLHRVKRDDALSAIRRLAPVFLELIIEKDEGEKPRYNIPKAFVGTFPMQQIRDRNARLKAIAPSRWDELVEMARIKPSPVITPPVACIRCGLSAFAVGMKVRIDGFPRCDGCERDYASAY